MNEKMKTIKDIAKAIGVSPASVSKALNGYTDVSKETRDKVIAAAEKYDYFPNRSAAQLANKNEDTIGLILPMIGFEAITDEYLLGIISGIYNFAESEGYGVAMFTSKTISNNNQNYVQLCRSNNLIGAIVQGLEKDNAQLPKLLGSDIPCVFIDMNLEGEKKSSISIDNEKACAEVVDVLAGLNHTHIVFLSGSEYASVTLDRLKGYEKGIERNKGLVRRVIESNFSKEDAYEKVKLYILSNPDVSAFFCASDLMAIGTLNACLDLGYEVPKDISIIGFDGLTVTTHVRPQLSTVKQNFFEIGRKAAEVLLKIYNSEEVQKHYDMDYALEIRQSISKKITK